IAAVEKYQIVVCDIRGVGLELQSENEGAHVLEEINKSYPQKYLIALTKENWPASVHRCFAACDQIFGKNIGVNDWIGILDQAIAAVVNPEIKWKKILSHLISQNVSIRRLLELQDRYVAAVLKGKSPFQDEKELVELPTDVKEMLIAFGKDIVVKAIVD